MKEVNQTYALFRYNDKFKILNPKNGKKKLNEDSPSLYHQTYSSSVISQAKKYIFQKYVGIIECASHLTKKKYEKKIAEKFNVLLLCNY